MTSEARWRVTVVLSPGPRQLEQVTLELSQACDVLTALRQSGLFIRFPEFDRPDLVVGVWGRPVDLSRQLRDQDRLEIYRPLKVDPKTARRERFVKQGARGPGLFARRRTASVQGA
jgi:putative ubiquitin-RnfH superfamily antitoxin RatB of RatAB toxin-antitoxin module